jgi:hypothetical protein
MNERTYDDSYTSKDGNLIALYIRLDNHYDIYERKVYSLLELLGDIGGL